MELCVFNHNPFYPFYRNGVGPDGLEGPFQFQWPEVWKRRGLAKQRILNEQELTHTCV